ncbi:DUF448 domain-containing protein [Sphingomonas arenae]|uniref:DUF448 domain-containing protein n=1 Tax=Sphingomonas arenae TaxID=2812555 RepID=UPI001F20F43C|nr:DUF448 domain-containing protein [Sphingomonas arenae]
MRSTRSGGGNAQTPERTCVLSRRTGSRDELIRLALGPDGQVLPDVRAKAPGRGAWIGVPRPELDSAIVKGKLKGALSRAFKTGELTVPSDLGEKIEAALRQAVLDRLGMEARSGNLINGADRVEQAARMGKVRLLLHAADAGLDGRRRLDQAWRVGGAEERGLSRGLEIPVERTILSMALGRENVVHVALIDPAAAARVLHALSRWRAFIGVGRGLEGGDAALATGSADLTNEGTE